MEKVYLNLYIIELMADGTKKLELEINLPFTEDNLKAVLGDRKTIIGYPSEPGRYLGIEREADEDYSMINFVKL